MKLPNQSDGFRRSFSTQSVLRQGTDVVPSFAIMRAGGGGGGVERACCMQVSLLYNSWLSGRTY